MKVLISQKAFSKDKHSGSTVLGKIISILKNVSKYTWSICTTNPKFKILLEWVHSMREWHLWVSTPKKSKPKAAKTPPPPLVLLKKNSQYFKGTVSLYKGRALLFLKTFEINRKT